MYKKLANEQGIETGAVQFIGSGFLISIPPNPDNTDYQAYLRWLEAGNTPEPAEEN